MAEGSYIELRIKMTTHYLGGRRDTEKRVRRINRRGGRVYPGKNWHEGLKSAAAAVTVPLDPSRFSFAEGFREPTIHFWRRRYNRTKTEDFEIIRKGTVITLNYYSPQGASEKYHEILWDFTGKHIGVSEFGPHMGWGRFEVVGVKNLKTGDND